MLGFGDSPIIDRRRPPPRARSRGRRGRPGRALGIPKGRPSSTTWRLTPGCTSEVVKFLSAGTPACTPRATRPGSTSRSPTSVTWSKPAPTMTEPDVLPLRRLGRESHHGQHLHARRNVASATSASTSTRAATTRIGAASQLDIDNDQLDAMLARPQPSPRRPSGRRSGPRSDWTPGKNPDWLARAADHTLVHDSQLASGPAWSGWSSRWAAHLPTSPATRLSSPGRTASLTAVARPAVARLWSAWQQASAPGGWNWGGTIAARRARRAPVTGDLPAWGKWWIIEVFTTTTRRRGPRPPIRPPWTANPQWSGLDQHRRQLREPSPVPFTPTPSMCWRCSAPDEGGNCRREPLEPRPCLGRPGTRSGPAPRA